ncbi:MAG: urate oxidase [Silvibacterium sp.]|nr:urate oxidase [Silvibacterium sp.]
MAIVLGENRYGKSRVRVMKVQREGARHEVFEWNVEVWLAGDFRSCFEDGDNSCILPTDTMKNTVYSLARDCSAASMEDFGIELVSHFIETNSHADSAGVRIVSTPWKHIDGFSDAFTHASDKYDTTAVTLSRDGLHSVSSGFEKLWLLKTAKSAFAGYMNDRLTTLRETQDRLFGTLATGEWRYTGTDLDYNALRRRIESALVTTFAAHDSLSVQQTLYAMARAALDQVNEIADVHLQMPNKHCNLVDLAPFGQDNPNEIFVPTDEPHGSIEARVGRTDDRWKE